MTTANLMNVPSVKGNVSTQIDASKKLQEESLEVAEAFAGLMNQTVELPDLTVDDTSSNMDVSKTNGKQSWSDSYERYTYKEKQIDTAKEPSVEEKLEEAKDVLDQTADEVLDTLSQEYGVDREIIENFLDDMGLNALDLLNPQNLVSFIVQLTGVASGEELLLDENFLTVMESMNHLADGLMKELDVDMNGLHEIISEMDMLQTNPEISVDFPGNLEQTIQSADELNLSKDTIKATESEVLVETVKTDVQNVLSTEDNVTTKMENIVADGETVVQQVEESVNQELKNQNEQNVSGEQISVEDTVTDGIVANDTVANDTATDDTVELVEEQPEDTSEKEVKTQVQDTEDNLVDHQASEKGFEGNNNQNSEMNNLLSQNTNENIMTTQVTSNISHSVEVPQMPQFNSYFSADTMQIMEQIVQQMRVTISNEITTMEMQMNPENLGKVYVNISSEEGVVNAQFHATNEVVKEALETQVATLRESLNQAGVKVDAIEVTIASHEFERNLEQQSQNPEENVNAHQANTEKRRNLNLDSLDELKGMMTEEETLVAQIMRENGNSVDFIA